MFGEILEEARDFFEDIFEHLFEKDKEKHKDVAAIERTKLAYQFTERVDSLMKIVFGASIFVSAIVASVWGFTAVGDIVRSLTDSIPGRAVLIFIGISYLINGIWRFFHTKS